MIDPSTLQRSATLKDGLVVTIRAVRQDDKERLREAFRNLESASIYARFFGFKKQLTDDELVQATEIDFDQTVTLVVTIDGQDDEIVIGTGTYAKSNATTAEVAFVVEEDYQRLGIARLILATLVEIARNQGLKRFEADVLPHNAAMLSVFRHCGLPMRVTADEGILHVTLDL